MRRPRRGAWGGRRPRRGARGGLDLSSTVALSSVEPQRGSAASSGGACSLCPPSFPTGAPTTMGAAGTGRCMEWEHQGGTEMPQAPSRSPAHDGPAARLLLRDVPREWQRRRSSGCGSEPGAGDRLCGDSGSALLNSNPGATA